MSGLAVYLGLDHHQGPSWSLLKGTKMQDVFVSRSQRSRTGHQLQMHSIQEQGLGKYQIMTPLDPKRMEQKSINVKKSKERCYQPGLVGTLVSDQCLLPKPLYPNDKRPTCPQTLGAALKGWQTRSLLELHAQCGICELLSKKAELLWPVGAPAPCTQLY